MNTKEIIYPYFLHCCHETDELFWKYIFEDLSYGRAPYGVYFTKGFICCGFKGKEFSYRINENKPIPELFQDIKKILQTKLGLQSTEDLINVRQKFDETTKELSLADCSDWSKVKKKEVKNLLLETFVIKNNPNESRIKLKKQLSTLLLALQLKIITNEDIAIENGKIISIKNWESLKNMDIKDWNINIK
jgi:hypothetical protein